MKTLLTGKPYVPSVETDLKKTFARIRREMKEQERPKEDKPSNIILIGHSTVAKG